MIKQFPAGRSSRGLARAQDPLPHGDAVHEVLQKGGQETQVYLHNCIYEIKLTKKIQALFSFKPAMHPKGVVL